MSKNNKQTESQIIWLTAKAKYTGRQFRDIIEDMRRIHNIAMMAQAKLKDVIEATRGKEINYRETDIRIARFTKKHNQLVRNSNKQIAELREDNKKWKRKANKYLGWIKKQFKKWRKRKAKALKKINKEYKDGNT